MDDIEKGQHQPQDILGSKHSDQLNENESFNHVAQENETEESELTDAIIEKEITEEIPINESKEIVSVSTVINDQGEMSTQEDFVEISDLDLVETPSHANTENLTGIHTKQGDLPDWLQEIIDEPEQPSTEEFVPIPQHEDVPPQESQKLDIYDWEKEHLETTDIEGNLKPIDEIDVLRNKQNLEDISLTLELSEEDTYPVPLTNPDDVLSFDKKGLFDLLEPQDKEHAFSEAKELVRQGDLQRALPILKTLLDQTDDDERFAELIENIVVDSGENIPEMWELTGDLALKQNKPESAFVAYAKAIHYLLILHEEKL